MKADDRILSAARKPKVARSKGPPAYRSPGRTLRRPEPLRRAFFGDRRFESFFLQRRESANHRSLSDGAEPRVRIPVPFKAASLEQTGSALFLGLGLARRGSCVSRRAAAALARAFSEMQAPTGPGGVEREL
jgi:hypothetical protein